MSTTPTAYDRILAVAADLFLHHGVRKTNVEEVAAQAGVTRVTVYRHFGDKRGLVLAVCRHLADVFRRADEECCRGQYPDFSLCLEQIGLRFEGVARGSVFAQLDEIRRLYPDIFKEYSETRSRAVDNIFACLLQTAERQGRLRKGLNMKVVRALFHEAVVRAMESPVLIAADVPADEVYRTITEVFQHGILSDHA